MRKIPVEQFLDGEQDDGALFFFQIFHAHQLGDAADINNFLPVHFLDDGADQFARRLLQARLHGGKCATAAQALFDFLNGQFFVTFFAHKSVGQSDPA